jgi:hypothetical protein
MKNQALITTLILSLIFGILPKSEAQLIFENDHYESYYYLTNLNNTASRYSLYTMGLWHLNGRFDAESKQKNAIKSIDYTSYKIKRDGQRKIQRYRNIKEYNLEGKIVKTQNFKKGKEKRLHQFVYNQDGWYTNYKETIRGKKTFSEEITYDNNNYVTCYRKSKNKALKSKWNAEYRDTVIVKQTHYRKDSEEVSSYWEYDYYPDNAKKETRYFRKGELKNRWSYTCDEEGKEIKKKGETQICELKQYNADSTYVVIMRTTGKKGKVSKDRFTYDKYDRLILTEMENVRGKIYSKYGTEYDKNGHVCANYTYGRGKKSDMIRWGTRYIKNEKGHLLSSERIRRDKVKSKTVYTRNEEGQILTSISTKPNGEQTWRSTYKYNDKGLLVERCSYNEKDDLVWIANNLYQYYE